MKKLMLIGGAVALSAMLPLATMAEDWTVSDDTALAEDTTVGALSIADGKTLYLDGHSLTVSNLAASSGSAYIIDTNAVYEATKSPEASDGQYIHGTGKLWINTDIVPECTDTIEAKIYVEASVNGTYVWSARDASLNGGMNLYVDNWKFSFRRNATASAGGSYQQAFTYTINADYGTGSFKIDKSNNTTATLTISDTSSYTVGGPLVLFAGCKSSYVANHVRTESQMGNFFCSGTANGGGVKLYYFRVRKSDGTLRCNFVPARIANSGVVGLFDKVSGKFVTRELKCNGVITAGEDAYEVKRVSGGELHVNVASGSVNNKSLMIGGGVRLVKEGAGTMTSTTAYGSRPCAYFGGTEVKGGTLTAGASGTNQVFGIDGGEVTVSSGGTLNQGASTGYFQNYRFTLNGGELTSNSGYTNIRKHIKYLRLDADSSVYSAHIVGLWDSNADGSEYYDTYIDLGSNTLSVTGDNNYGRMCFGKTTAISEGAIDVKAESQGLYFVGDDSDFSRVSVTAAANLKVADGVTVTLGDYIVNAVDNRVRRYRSGTGNVKVVGTFKPNTDYYHGCELQDGATLDLSGRSAALNLDGSLVDPRTDDAQYRVSFADGATIRIAIGGRHVSSTTALVTWTEPPANLGTLKFICAAGATRGFVVKSDGIYLAPQGLIISFF